MSDATSYRLWGRPTSVNVQKVLVALEACGIDDFEMVHASAWMAPGRSTYSAVDAEVAAVNTEAYKAMNPTPTVPTLELPGGGGALWVPFTCREVTVSVGHASHASLSRMCVSEDFHFDR